MKPPSGEPSHVIWVFTYDDEGEVEMWYEVTVPYSDAFAAQLGEEHPEAWNALLRAFWLMIPRE